MVKLQYSVPALTDFKKSIYDFISIDSAFNAKRFIRELKERIKILKTYPDQGRTLYPDRDKDLKQLLYKHYRIIYTYNNSIISIITIHHQSRELSNIDSLKPFET